MGKIRKLTIYTEKIPCDISFLVISDIHRDKNKGKENLMRIKDLVDLSKIDSVIIPGDIVNDVNDLAERIDEWFRNNRDSREQVRKACMDEIDKEWNPYYQITILKKGLNI